jgi:hypothetical protein
MTDAAVLRKQLVENLVTAGYLRSSQWQRRCLKPCLGMHSCLDFSHAPMTECGTWQLAAATPNG